MSDFREAEHPRQADGRFSTKATAEQADGWQVLGADQVCRSCGGCGYATNWQGDTLGTCDGCAGYGTPPEAGFMTEQQALDRLSDAGLGEHPAAAAARHGDQLLRDERGFVTEESVEAILDVERDRVRAESLGRLMPPPPSFDMPELGSTPTQTSSGTEWREPNGFLHRTDGPAFVSDDDDVHKYLRHALPHRTDGPAYYRKSTGTTEWYVRGERVDPPKVVETIDLGSTRKPLSALVGRKTVVVTEDGPRIGVIEEPGRHSGGMPVVRFPDGRWCRADLTVELVDWPHEN